MIRQGLVQVVAQEPPDTEPVGRQAQQLTLGADPLEEHDQLEAEEDHRIDGGAPDTGDVAVPHQLAREAEVEDAVQVAVEVVGRHQRLE